MSALKYETLPDPSGLLRIRALKDIPQHGVKTGDLGGLIEHERNLSQSGHAWVSGHTQVFGDAQVSGDAQVFGDAQVSGNAWVTQAAQVSGDAQVFGNARVSGNAQVFGHAQVSGNAWITQAAQVFGHAQVSGNAWVSGSAQVFGDASIADAADLLTAKVQASSNLDATLFRQKNSYVLRVGCWEGTVPEFRAMIESDTWIEATVEQIELRRPELLAFTAMCEARIATWTNTRSTEPERP